MESAWADRYGRWIDGARPLLEAGRWREAFSVGYPHLLNETAPFVPLRTPLSRCTVVPVTSGGLFLRAAKDPFDEPNIEGDYSYRKLPTTLMQGAVSVSHGHYDPASALADLNCVFPGDRLRELAVGGTIAGVAPTLATILHQRAQRTLPGYGTWLESPGDGPDDAKPERPPEPHGGGVRSDGGVELHRGVPLLSSPVERRPAQRRSEGGFGRRAPLLARRHPTPTRRRIPDKGRP